MFSLQLAVSSEQAINNQHTTHLPSEALAKEVNTKHINKQHTNKQGTNNKPFLTTFT